MKKVTYQGQNFEVANWANYIAADANGDVWVYSQPPLWNERTGAHMPSPSGSFSQYVGKGPRPKPPVLTI